MAISVVIKGVTYSIPVQGQNPAWGEDLSSILEALADASASFHGAYDIAETTQTIANNQSTTNLVGASFDTSAVQSAIVYYSVYRSTNSNEVVEVGEIFVAYKPIANSWELSRQGTGNAGITLSITSAGQIQYATTNLAGAGYVGNIKFNAKAFEQV